MGGVISSGLPPILDEKTIRKLSGDEFDEEEWKLCKKDQNGNITREEFVAFLQFKNTDIDQHYTEGPSMCAAAADGRVRTIQLQVENDLKNPDTSHSSYAGKTPMLTAAFQGHADAVKFLCFKGADVNKASYSGETPAHAAAENNQSNALRFCIDAGADLQLRDCRGFTPLHIAAQMSSFECLHLLIHVGAPLNSQAIETDYCTPLGLASMEGQIKAMEILIKGGADLNAPSDSGGVTALALSARHGQIDSLKTLLKAGADVCCGGSINGATACHEAAKWGKETCLSIVLNAAKKRGEQGYIQARDFCNQGDAQGFTPFYYAAERGQMQTAIMLILNGANVYKASTDGSTPEMIAYANDHQHILDLIKKQAKDLLQEKCDGKKVIQGYLKAV